MEIKHIKLFAILGILCNLISIAHAAGAGFYLGTQVGQSDLNNIPMTVSIGPLPGQNQYIPDPSNTGIAERLFIGANLNDYAGVEFGYSHFTPSSYDPVQPFPNCTPSENAAGLCPADSELNPTIRESGVDLLGKGMFQFPEISKFYRLGVFGKLGFAYVRRSLSGSLTNQAIDPTAKRNGTTNNFRPEFGFGASFDFTPNWELDVSANRILAGSNDFKEVDFYAIGISYHFVTLYCGQFIC